MKQVRLLMAGLFLMISGVLFAQEISVSGTVVDASTGEPVPYASIQIKGTTTGASTDDLGKFTMTVNSNATLIFSSIGYVTVELPVEGKTQVMVEMSPDAVMLEEAIVVGYGTAKKITSVVGSASTVRAKALENRPVANAADALQGQVAGMQVFSHTGEPLSTSTIRLRGVNSINAGTTPLIILDGAPVSSSIFSTLSGNDIESINVLKDASSTAIYGSRAANGVIYITTKKGKKGEKARIQIRGQYGFSSLINHKVQLMNTEQWFAFNEMVNPSFLTHEMAMIKDEALANGVSTDWLDYVFKSNAPIYSVEANISGATDRTDYYISLSTHDETGTAPFSEMARYGVRSNINTKVNDWFKFGINLGLTYQDALSAGYTSARTTMYNPVNWSNWMVPWISPYTEDENGNRVRRKKYEELPGLYDLYYLMETQPRKNNYTRLNGSMYEELTPVKGLTIRAAQAIDAYDYSGSSKADPEVGGPWEGDGSAQEVFNRYASATLTNTIEYKFTHALKHNFAFLVGQEAIMTSAKSFGGMVGGITDMRFNELQDGKLDNPDTAFSSSTEELAYNSYFARVSYDYDDRYFIDASYRIDGSSLFGANHRYAQFYSVGAMWNIKGEKFMQDVYWLDDLRLKFSYGTTGNSSISNYMAYGTVGSIGFYNGQMGYGIANTANPDLTWEVVESLNVGLSARFFDRLGVSVDFYDKTTKDMLMVIPYSYTTGVSGAWGNIGNMKNTGVELEITADIVRTRDWYFGISANFGYNKNVITKLFDGRDEFNVANTGVNYTVGHAYGDLYYPISAGVDPRDGRQMWYDLDGNKTKLYSENLAQFTGMNMFAPWAGGVQLNVVWKGLSLSADFAWVAEKYIMNNDKFFLINAKFLQGGEQNGSVELLNIWREPGDITDIPKYGEEIRFDTSLVEDASFLRLKNLQLAYSFPTELIRKSKVLEGVRIYAMARNLWTLTKYSGYDPEVGSNLQMGNYPNSRQYTFGIELTF